MNGQVRPTEASDHPTTRPRPNRGHDVHLHHPPGRPPRMMALIALCDRARSAGLRDVSLGCLESTLRGRRPSPWVCHSYLRLKRTGSAASAQLLVRLLGHRPTCRSMPARGGRCRRVRRDGALHPLSVVLAWRVMSVMLHCVCLHKQLRSPHSAAMRLARAFTMLPGTSGLKSVSANAYSPACSSSMRPSATSSGN